MQRVIYLKIKQVSVMDINEEGKSKEGRKGERCRKKRREIESLSIVFQVFFPEAGKKKNSLQTQTFIVLF